ncbi:MAG: DUF938 domain-containing protein [Burkholderiaceae bacterium]
MSGRIFFSPSAERNQQPIFESLVPLLPASGLVLEIASGSGQHVTYFAERTPHLQWQPTDPDQNARLSISARLEQSPLRNVRAPLELDVQKPWPVSHANAVFCANMLHIAPWTAGFGLLEGAAAVLSPGAPLILYGPYLQRNVRTAPGNLAFDQDLRQRNASWGVRKLEAVQEAAASVGFESGPVTAMPANNLLVVFIRRDDVVAGEP